MSFKDLGLSDKTIRAIEDLGYTEPTTVQKDVIPSVLAGKDIFTIAPASCGKTCSYIFPLIDIISQKRGQNILIITADNREAVKISDKFSIFNKYHEENDNTEEADADDNESEANVIIAAPDLLLDNLAENRIDLSSTHILVVDDINLIKKKRQLKKLDKILELLPVNKQNIVFTTRRSKETQDTLDKILKTPAEIKIDKAKESEITALGETIPELPAKKETKENKTNSSSKYKTDLKPPLFDKRAQDLSRRFKVFGKKVPAFLLANCKFADEDD